eukprot:jgi/Psemu1/32688/gm1.32688_g
MPATTDFDWNAIRDIDFSFGKLPNPADADQHGRLNQAFSQHLYYEETESLFITHKDGTKTLGLNPVTILRELIIDEIFDCLPSKARTETTKQHIVTLFQLSTMWHIAANGSLGRIRNKATLDAAAQQVIANHSPVLCLQMHIPHWGFKTDWWPYNFMSVYDTNIYSSPKKSNTRKATTVADKTPNASRARFANLPQRKSDPYQSIPLQRKPVASDAHMAIQFPAQATSSIIDTPAPSDLLHATYTSTSSIVNASVPSPYKAIILSDTTKIVDSNAAATPVEALSAAQAPFRWTFTPQHDIATFRRLPKSAPSPSPPSGTLGEATDLPNAIPAYIRSLRTHAPVLRLSKRHRDALIVKLYHLYANILSMNWFYDFFD